MCIPAIDERMFDLGCLGPALAIIVVLACLKRRKKLELEFYSGHPGLLVPINFLRSFSYSNRFTIAATFGATASTCLRIFTYGKTGLFPLGGPAWVKVFHGLIAVLVYGILFYPFFACLTTKYKLVGASLGFLYAAIRFFFQLGISFQCWSSYHGELKRVLSIEVLGFVPTYACLLFVMVRFAVLLYLQVRRKWFRVGSTSGFIERIFEVDDTSLIKEPGIRYVRQLFNRMPLLRPAVEYEKWYMRLIHFIYRSRADFKFSTQFISTVVVAAIVIFQLSVSIFAALGTSKKSIRTIQDETIRTIYGIVLDSLQGGFAVSALVTALLLLHFMKCHREHVLQLYGGRRKIMQEVVASPSKLVGKSLRFSGYQIAYTLIGFLTFGTFLMLLFSILGFFFKYAKQISPELWAEIKDLGLAVLPSISMAGVLLLFQMFLATCIFRDGEFPNITINVDNRRLFSIMSYFFFFYNILLGIFSCTLRIVFGSVLGVLFLSRIDRTTLMPGYQAFDRGFIAYLGFINVLVAHSHPVMLMFCQLLINRNKDRGSEQFPQKTKHCTLPDSSMVTGSAPGAMGVITRVPRLPRLSQKVVNRWLVAMTLLRNPSLIKYRQQGGIASTVAVSLTSIRADVSALV
ncbi:unnamed protein product [Porites lobata]|uniref:Uncharacterized protein n=1 Tax=Porites lobata TaxID=104759 RepID=A0ABN8PPS6_9CNID|nr:unnamed protein product [Porites lobata]